jgi:hypothetical protein
MVRGLRPSVRHDLVLSGNSENRDGFAWQCGMTAQIWLPEGVRNY